MFPFLVCFGIGYSEFFWFSILLYEHKVIIRKSYNIINDPLSTVQKKEQTWARTGPLNQAKTAVSGNSSLPNFNDRYNLSPDVPKGADNLITTQLIRHYIGTRYSLCTSPSATVNNLLSNSSSISSFQTSCFLFDHYSIWLIPFYKILLLTIGVNKFIL
jgi:hypothetical protein